MKNSWLLLAAGLLVGMFILLNNPSWYKNAWNLVASVFFSDSSTPDILHAAYNTAQAGGQKFKILIVPGHDSVASGTSFGGLSEADLALAEGKLLAAQFSQDPNVEVRLARTDGWYEQEIAKYFVDHRKEIIAYRASQMALMQSYMASGVIQSDVVVDHNVATNEVALRLYGINLWANHNNYQLLIHIHFNDIPWANRAKSGPYTGFAIYVPEHQFSNAKGSLAVGQAIEEKLLQTYHISTLPAESAGPTEDQGLIAIGSNNSLDASSVLIEYAYIYEPLLQQKSLRASTLQTIAQETYQGVEDFLKR